MCGPCAPLTSPTMSRPQPGGSHLSPLHISADSLDIDVFHNSTSVSFTVDFQKVHSLLCACVCTCVSWCTCGGHRAAVGIQLSPIIWDLGTDLKLQGLASKHLYWLSHLIHPPTYRLLKSGCVFLRTPSLSMGKTGLVPVLQIHLLSSVPVLIGVMIIIQFIIQCSESITPQLSLIH